MRLGRPALFALFAISTAVVAQQPLALGPDLGAGMGRGLAKYFAWYTATPTGGCVAGANGYCVGVGLRGDSYYWTAWLPNASGLPVTGGLPIVGTINDYNAASCSGNIGLLQLDTWSWASPTASHVTTVNCMTSYGRGSDNSGDTPAGWKGMMYSGDSSAVNGSWKSRTPFSKLGILYMPVERQIHAGTPSIHDATFIASPDSGAHWCNPYTWAHRAGSPGCDSSNWQADGDAPKCDAPSAGAACTNTGYLDSSHSSLMWKALPSSAGETFQWVNYGYQDGQTSPAGINDGCDPAVYTCFMRQDGTIARVPNAAILDISAWRYYTCPAIAQSYRCSGSDSSSWTATFADRTPVMVTGYFNPMYIKEFKSYISTTWGDTQIYFSQAPTIQGPWSELTWSNVIRGNFGVPSPALGYNVIGTTPPHIQLGKFIRGCRGFSPYGAVGYGPR
jgi:hypothetical protein